MEIDLSADLILIHGRNGTGKTSVFNALEWGLLGEVEHIDDTSSEGDNRPPFINLFSTDGVAAVNLKLESAGIGERVYAIGAPEGLELTLSDGLVSGFRHRNGQRVIQNTAPISHGSSGGGLLILTGSSSGLRLSS
jgi:S1-C subfamily serine protease